MVIIISNKGFIVKIRCSWPLQHPFGSSFCFSHLAPPSFVLNQLHRANDSYSHIFQKHYAAFRYLRVWLQCGLFIRIYQFFFLEQDDAGVLARPAETWKPRALVERRIAAVNSYENSTSECEYLYGETTHKNQFTSLPCRLPLYPSSENLGDTTLSWAKRSRLKLFWGSFCGEVVMLTRGGAKERVCGKINILFDLI